MKTEWFTFYYSSEAVLTMAFYPLAKRSSIADAFLTDSGAGFVFVFEFYLAYSRRALAALVLSLMFSGSLNLDFNLVATI